MKTKKEKQSKIHVIYSNEYDDALFQELRKENADETEEYVWDVYHDLKTQTITILCVSYNICRTYTTLYLLVL